MLMLLSVHVTSVLFLAQFSNFALTMVWASIGVTLSYSSRPFLCALGSTHTLTHTRKQLLMMVDYWASARAVVLCD